MDGTVLCVGLPDPGYGGRSVRVFLADQTGTFVERLNVTAPNNGPAGSRFGAQVCWSCCLPCPCTSHCLPEWVSPLPIVNVTPCSQLYLLSSQLSALPTQLTPFCNS